MLIFLTGFPGCGKTYLGNSVSLQLKLPFVDTDHLLAKELNEPVTSVFKTKGENYFRLKESELLRSMIKKRRALISTGGGMPCYHDNMRWMNENGITIYLEASAAFLFHRLVKEKSTRPLISHLTDVELMIYITETLSSRRQFYEKGQLKLNAETITPARLISVIRKKLN